MGNLTYIIPTENKEKNNFGDILKLLKEKFCQYDYHDDGISSITINRKDGTPVTTIFINDTCWMINYDEDIENLKEIAKECQDKKLQDRFLELVEDMKKLKKLNPNLNESICMTYGTRDRKDVWWRERGDIEFFLRDIFKGYIFDEGIHPEFMGPNYIRTPEPKLSWWRKFSYSVIGIIIFPFLAISLCKSKSRF